MAEILSAYKQLEEKFHKISTLSGAAAILGWDNAVMMPAGGADARAEQLATLGVISHEMLCDLQVSDLLDEAEDQPQNLSAWQLANLREMRRDWKHATAVSSDLVEALSKATSKCEMIWRQAREDNDFESLRNSLEEVVRLTKIQADVKSEAFQLSPYDALLDQYEPGCSEAQIDILFDDLEEFLPPILQQVLDRQEGATAAVAPKGPFDIEKQRKLGLHFMEKLGFDFNRGRLDISHHPLTGGIPDDVRLTTRYDEADFTQSLMGTLHETGHALYEQNLPLKWRGQPVGLARGMALHESQSLLVEMQLSRSEAFLEYAYPLLEDVFGDKSEAWSFENIKKLYHRVERGLIRVDADEVTYPLHVILRYRLEKQLLSGDLPVAQLPQAWNDGMQQLLGVRPQTDSMGCLQDIHWPSGAIGYFPTYTLGALSAAQFFTAANEKLPELTQDVKTGRFEKLTNWMADNIHQSASFETTDEVLKRVTGRPLSTEAFKKHLIQRYLKD